MKTKFHVRFLAVVMVLLLTFSAFNFNIVKATETEDTVTQGTTETTTPSKGATTQDTTTPSVDTTTGTTAPTTGATTETTAPSTGATTGTTAPSTGATTGTTAPSTGATTGTTAPSTGATTGTTAPTTGATTGTTEPNAGATTGTTTPDTTAPKMTAEEIVKVIPEKITVSVKESDAIYSDEVYDEVQKTIQDILKENDIELEYNNLVDMNMYFYAYSVYENGKADIYHYDFGLVDTSNNSYKTVGKKRIEIVYANSNKRNSADEKYVKDKIANTKIDVWATAELKSEGVDFENIEAQFEAGVKKALNDDSINIKLTWEGEGGYWFWWKYGYNVYFFKNDVLYDVKEYTFNFVPQVIVPEDVRDTNEAYIAYALPKIKEFLVEDNPYYLGTFDDITLTYKEGSYYNLHGESMDEEDMIIIKKASKTKVIDYITINSNAGVKLSGERIDESNENYFEMLGKVREKGYRHVFNAYELKVVSGKINGKLAITFDIGKENNGKKMIVVHKKSDGSYEEFERTVTDGKITIEVSELSPFMVASSEELSRVLDGEPKEGVENYVAFTSVVALIALAGIVVVKFKK